jgi:hypothetical protein
MATMLSKATGKEIDTLRLSKEEFYSDKHRESVGEVFWPQYRNYVEGWVQTRRQWEELMTGCSE